jgi:hypothetical protein
MSIQFAGCGGEGESLEEPGDLALRVATTCPSRTCDATYIQCLENCAGRQICIDRCERAYDNCEATFSCIGKWKLTCTTPATCGSYSVTQSGCVVNPEAVRWGGHTPIGSWETLGADGRRAYWTPDANSQCPVSVVVPAQLGFPEQELSVSIR